MAYTVAKGDTLTNIAKKLGTTVTALASTNNIKDINRIYAGQTLMLPGDVPATDHPLGTTTSTAPRSLTPIIPVSTEMGTKTTTPSNLPKYTPPTTASRVLSPVTQQSTATTQNRPLNTSASTNSTTSRNIVGNSLASGTGMTNGTIQPQQPAPVVNQQPAEKNSNDLFNEQLAAMLKAAQGYDNSDLMAKRNAIIQARFNTNREATPEELRVLSPEAQSGLRGLDSRGLETQLGGINTALESRQEKQKNEQDAYKTNLDLLLKKQQLDEGGKPASVQEYEYAKKNGYDGSYIDYQNEDSNRKILAATIANATGLTPSQQAQFLNVTNNYQKDALVQAYDKGQGLNAIADQVLANPDSATNQLKSLYILVKNLDPDSAVREGEIALANKTTSYFQRFQTALESVYNGQVIPADTAKDLANATKELVSAWEVGANARKERYTSQANVLGIGDAWSQYLGTSSGISSQDDPLGIFSKPLSTGLNGSGLVSTYKYEGNNYTGVTPKSLNTLLGINPDTFRAQCGRLINAATDIGVGDSYQSKLSKTDPKIKMPSPGLVFVMPTGTANGHTGLVAAVDLKRGVILAYDANWESKKAPEQLRVHEIPISKIAGYALPKKTSKLGKVFYKNITNNIV